MCLNIKSGPHVAKKDFYTLKIAKWINKVDSTSPYKNFKYVHGKAYESSFFIYFSQVEEGLHSLVVQKGMSGGSWSVGYDLWRDYCLYPVGLLLCKVPKGAIYYLGKDMDVVSNKLEIVCPVITTEEDSAVVEDGIQAEHTNFINVVKLAEEWMLNSDYNIEPS